jgi:hypothetical protein
MALTVSPDAGRGSIRSGYFDFHLFPNLKAPGPEDHRIEFPILFLRFGARSRSEAMNPVRASGHSGRQKSGGTS